VPEGKCTVNYIRHPGKIRGGSGHFLSDDDLIPTDPACVVNDDWTAPFCRAGKFPQSLAIGIERCKVACAARPNCKSIGISHPTRGTSAECFLGGEVNDQDNPLQAYGHWDWYDIEEVCEPDFLQKCAAASDGFYLDNGIAKSCFQPSHAKTRTCDGPGPEGVQSVTCDDKFKRSGEAGNNLNCEACSVPNAKSYVSEPYTCKVAECNDGYSFADASQTACVDTDGCAANPCHPASHQYCVDKPAPATGFACHCKEGVTEGASTEDTPATCTDQDHCKPKGKCGTFAVCEDQPPPGHTFECMCDTGASPTAGHHQTIGHSIQCEDDNPCLNDQGDPTDVCGAGAECTNLQSPLTGFTCSCSTGFHGDDTSSVAASCTACVLDAAGCATAGSTCAAETCSSWSDASPKLACNAAKQGYYLDVNCAEPCSTVPNAAPGATTTCTAKGNSRVSECATGYYKIDNAALGTSDECVLCAEQTGCAGHHDHCSVADETLKACHKADTGYYLITDGLVMASPSAAPTFKPTEAPTLKPTEAPTLKPTEPPTLKPTEAPTLKPVPATSYKPIGDGYCYGANKAAISYCDQGAVSHDECKRRCDIWSNCNAFAWGVDPDGKKRCIVMPKEKENAPTELDIKACVFRGSAMKTSTAAYTENGLTAWQDPVTCYSKLTESGYQTVEEANPPYNGQPNCHGKRHCAIPSPQSCAGHGLADVGPSDCVAAAQSLGFDFSAQINGGHKFPIAWEPAATATVCMVCENMIYQGRPDLLILANSNSASCHQDGQQTKQYICKG
jgi:hypothetical protein